MRHIRTARTARLTALLGAVATLLAALFLCLGQPETTPGTTAHGAHRGLTTAGLGPSGSAYDCPYDRGACGLYPDLTAAVLTAPPLDGPSDGDGLAVGPGRIRQAPGALPTGAPSRAPDLHVLQVLRT